MTKMTGDQGIVLPDAALASLLPLHLLLGRAGQILGAGPTMRKVLPPGAEFLRDGFRLSRSAGDRDDIKVLDRLADCADRRIFLRMTHEPRLTLRGQVVRLGDDMLLLNLGFGIGLPDAVREFGLTDRDFTPSQLAMELLFLHEANRAIMGELSRFNLSLEQAREAAELQAFTDPLTGLYNRRGLELALDVCLRGVDAAGDGGDRCAGFAVLHLDLDRFKEVNDQLGHAAGDEVLRHVAQVLRRMTRSNDTVARTGGDEFVVLLPDLSSTEVLSRLAGRIIAGIEQPVNVETGACRVSASVGITTSAMYRRPAAEAMLADADIALYRAKRMGRGRAEIFQAKQEGSADRAGKE